MQPQAPSSESIGLPDSNFASRVRSAVAWRGSTPVAAQLICFPVTNAMGKVNVYLFTTISGAIIMPVAFLLGVNS